MKKIFLSDEPNLEIFLRRNSISRRMSLRISALDGKITLTGPRSLNLKEFEKFAESKKSWLKSTINSFDAPIFVSEGAQIPVLGNKTLIALSDVKKPKKTGNILYVNSNKAVASQVKNYLIEICKVHLGYICSEFAERLNAKLGKMSLRDTRSRWGSCSSDSNLMFSWRLIMAPEDILAYVAAHEVAHLKYMNHSKEFWKTVEYLFGPYQKERTWLKKNGSSLHRYRFQS